jgi:hypothetical protein
MAQGRAFSAQLEKEASFSGSLANTGDLAFLGESRNGLLCELDPINRTDPSGKWSNLAAQRGVAVHQYIGDAFTKSVPGGFSGPSVITILQEIGVKLPSKLEGAVTALFPDLTDTVKMEVYEIKPDNARSFALGEAQLEAYIDLFNYLDPRKGWHRGTTYTPPLTVPIDALTYAAAVRVVPGMIVYKTISLRQIVVKKAAQTGASQIADMNDSIGIATLNTLLGKF